MTEPTNPTIQQTAPHVPTALAKRSKFRRILSVILILLTATLTMNAENETVAREDMGKELRKLIFSTPPADLDLKSDSEFPQIYGIVVDWRIGEDVATIVALRDGAASLYTTSAFGIIGGDSHDAVRKAASDCTKAAEPFLDGAVPTRDFPYPKEGEVLFYFLAYDGIRVAVAKEDDIYGESDRLTPVFASAQKVLTQLRSVAGRN